MASSTDQIRNLVNDYYHLMDLGDYARVAALYGDDGILKGLTPEGDVLGLWTGQAEILALWRSIVRLYAGSPRTKHCVFNLVIEVDEPADTATSKSYFCVFQATPDLPLQPITLGRWHDTLERVNGAWQFVQRDCYSDLYGDLGAHMQGAGIALAEARINA